MSKWYGSSYLRRQKRFDKQITWSIFLNSFKISIFHQFFEKLKWCKKTATGLSYLALAQGGCGLAGLSGGGAGGLPLGWAVARWRGGGAGSCGLAKVSCNRAINKILVLLSEELSKARF